MNRNIWFVIMLILVAFPVFSHLTALPIQFWDESRLAVSAFEMTQSGNWLIPTFGDVPDMWSTKPPLMIWLIAGCMKILGPTEMAVRLPSAIAAIITCILWFWLIMKKWAAPRLALTTCIILISSEGYMRLHGVRTGDYDSLLVLFVNGYIIFYYLFITEDRKRYLYYFFLFLTAAALTKGIAALLFLPGLLIYTIVERKLLQVFKNPALYIGYFLFLSVVIGYYLCREYYNPGFINAVWQNELWGRYSTVIEDHNGSWTYYTMWLRNKGFSYWFPLLPFGFIASQLFLKQDFKSFSFYISILIISFFFILSGSKTQLEWYDMAAYPTMSALVALLLYTVHESICSSDSISRFVRICLISIIGLFY
jgi:4-amino-4-deoxy-L-arabinose transferase-like glycosyltransferase